ncbi:hypothetical protein [Prescottella subtropica]|uniref:hypothetical protein n=1 Tax=Prescottella subtropica TaxID=2545757 RepID=UPI0010F9A296|nr:hypothetical protein [Prescottella subtropica]
MTVHDDEMLGPPFSAESIADLHAGVLSDEESARLWPLVRQDPAAVEVLAALDAVSGRLRETGRDHDIGIPVPDDVARRIGAALALQAPADPATVTALDTARSRRRRGGWIGAATVAAAAVGAVFVFGGVENSGPSDDTPLAASPTASPTAGPASITDLGSDLDGTQVLTLLGNATAMDPAGPLTDPQKREGCLQSIGVARTTPVLAIREVRFRGAVSVLVLVPGPRPPGLTALVVGSGCDATHPDLLTRTDIG